MRKINIFFNLLLFFTIILSSCDNTKTYAELLAEEKSAVAKLIADSFVVIPFNEDSLYTKDNKYVMQLSNGLYLAIVSKGNMSDTAITNKTKVTYRFKSAGYVNDTLFLVSNISHLNPAQFIYGQGTTNFADYYYPTSMSCEGIQSPLQYVGNGGVVKLIIPSKIGFTDMQTSVKPMYIQDLKYTFSLQY